jgi:hypothetical protein
MTIFQLVRIALDRLEEQGTKKYGSKLDDEIIKQLDYLKDSYAALKNPSRTPIKYRDPAVRFAYVYKYVGAHADYLVQALERFEAAKGPIFTTKEVRVSCLGGGPGSDIVGVLKHLADHPPAKPVEKFTCYLLDKELAWADVWNELGASLIPNVHTEIQVEPLDVTNPESWEYLVNFRRADLFTLIYFVSEIWSLKSKVARFWRDLFEDAKPGALFLFLDNLNAEFTDYFDEKCEAAGLGRLLSVDDPHMTPHGDEQASELKKYIKRFGPAAHNPKVQAKVSYRVWRKPLKRK